MKAISIKQPWTSLIAHGIKDIENRTWKTNFRGKVYIHASSNFAFRDFEEVLTHQQLEKSKELNCVLHTSAIIGEVEIVDCVINHTSIWAEKTPVKMQIKKSQLIISDEKPIYNWVLANPILYDEPILNIKGKLSFWEFEK